MAETNPNLLLNDEAEPDEGLQSNTAKQWYGGNMQIDATGEFDGASVEVVFCTHIPPLQYGKTYASNVDEDDWIVVETFTEPGTKSIALNPCLVAARVSTPGANSRVRVVIG